MKVHGQFSVVVNQVLVFGILMLIGMVLARVRILTADVLHGISQLIVKLLLPALIFHLIIGNGITVARIAENQRFALALLLCFAFLCLFGFAMGGVSHLKGSSKDIFVVTTMFCNIGFMGVPLLEAMFPGNVQVATCLLIYSVIDQGLLWSVGLFLCTRHSSSQGLWVSVRNLMNPMLAGIIIAMLLLYFEITLPQPIMTVAKGLGDASRYLALLYLGGVLGSISFLSMLLRPHAYLLIGLKMVVLPVVVFNLGGLFFDPVTQTVLATIISLPPMVATTMMAKTYGGDDTLATEVVFMGTIACLVTIPLVNLLIRLF